MAQNPFFIVVAIIAFLFGLGFLFFPDATFSMYGIAATDVGRLAGRFFGSSLIALGIIYYAARDLQEPDVLSGVLWAGLILNIADLVLASVATIGGIMNAMGWASVVLHIVLGAGFGYLIFGRPAEA
jgi:hypothetical protein